MKTKDMVFSTLIAQKRVNQWIKTAENVLKDTQQEKRLAAHQCKACFYGTSVSGRAMTAHSCGACGKEEVFPNTDFHALCMECAKKDALCKRCGGDLEMNLERSWPGEA